VYTIIERGQSVYLGEDLPGEYTHSRYTQEIQKHDRKAARAKNKAVSGLGEMIEISTNRRWEKTKHPHNKDAKYGVYRYDSTFAFPVTDPASGVVTAKAYDAQLLILNASNGEKYLYDVVNIKENTAVQIDLTKKKARSAAYQAAPGRSVSSNNIPKSGGNVNSQSQKYSLKEFQDGTRFVDVKTDQARFDGLNDKEMSREARKVIQEKFKGKVIGIDNRAYVKGRTAAEYAFPMKKLPSEEHGAKMRASTELDNLLDAGSNFRTEPDGRDGHIHPEAIGDFCYFDTIFKVADEYYSGVINIMPIKRGLWLKDITKIRNITQDIRSSYGDKPLTTFLRDASMDSISQSGQESNSQSQEMEPFSEAVAWQSDEDAEREQAELRVIMQEQLAEIHKIDSSVNSLEDIMKGPGGQQFYDYVQNRGLSFVTRSSLPTSTASDSEAATPPRKGRGASGARKARRCPRRCWPSSGTSTPACLMRSSKATTTNIRRTPTPPAGGNRRAG